MTPIERLEKICASLERKLERSRAILARCVAQIPSREAKIVDLEYEVDLLKSAIKKLEKGGR
jgi:hypothetical protein